LRMKQKKNFSRKRFLNLIILMSNGTFDFNHFSCYQWYSFAQG
jgi:hypothetical protein